MTFLCSLRLWRLVLPPALFENGMWQHVADIRPFGNCVRRVLVLPISISIYICAKPRTGPLIDPPTTEVPYFRACLRPQKNAQYKPAYMQAQSRAHYES